MTKLRHAPILCIASAMMDVLWHLAINCMLLPPPLLPPPKTQVVMAREDRWQDVLLWQPNLKEALYAISILVFGFNSSANTISIFSEVGDLLQCRHGLLAGASKFQVYAKSRLVT